MRHYAPSPDMLADKPAQTRLQFPSDLRNLRSSNCDVGFPSANADVNPDGFRNGSVLFVNHAGDVNDVEKARCRMPVKPAPRQLRAIDFGAGAALILRAQQRPARRIPPLHHAYLEQVCLTVTLHS